MEIKPFFLTDNFTFNKENIAAWEKRSKLYGSDPKGVLFKGLPDIFNEHIHRWQLKRILSEINIKSNDINILDIGCGYGRISLPVLKAFPCAKIIGVDVSPNYVDLFRKNTGQHAFVSRAEDIANNDLGLFDYIICVTVLMYLEQNVLETTLSNIIKSLNNKGYLLLIEPSHSGMNFQTCFGLLNIFKRQNRTDSEITGGNSFQYAYLRGKIEKSGGRVLKEYRMPATTILFLMIYLFTSLFSVKGRFFLDLISKVDELFKFNKIPSIYIFYVIEKQ